MTVEVIQLTHRQKIWETRRKRYGQNGRSKQSVRSVIYPITPDKKIPTREIPFLSDDDLARFNSYILKNEDCWIWQGSTSGNATHKYGDITINSTSYRAHRIAFALANGGIPDGMVIDHKCQNTLCVNPSHLDAVTQAENTRRGRSYPTHCKRGHLLDSDNVRLDGTHRRCRKCSAIRQAEYRKRQNAQNHSGGQGCGQGPLGTAGVALP